MRTGVRETVGVRERRVGVTGRVGDMERVRVGDMERVGRRDDDGLGEPVWDGLGVDDTDGLGLLTRNRGAGSIVTTSYRRGDVAVASRSVDMNVKNFISLYIYPAILCRSSILRN